MNLKELSIKYGANKVWTLTHDYLASYELHFGKFITQAIDLLEIGVQYGGSLRMWEEFFPKAKIIGIDIDPECSKVSAGRISVVVGDQGDRDFLDDFSKDKTFDIVIDDGSHQVTHQIGTFQRLWPIVKPGGLYIIEDLHTSYWPKWGGRYGDKSTTISFIKAIIDTINWMAISHEKAENYRMNFKSIGARSIHIYSGICFIEKE